MKDFSLTVFSLSFVIGMVSLCLCGHPLEKFCKRVFSWLILAAILPFLLNFGIRSLSIPDFPLPDEPNTLTNVTKGAVEEGLAKAIASEFGIEEDNVRVILLHFSAETFTAEKVSVFLSGSDILKDQRGIRAFVEEQKIGFCEVIYENG